MRRRRNDMTSRSGVAGAVWILLWTASSWLCLMLSARAQAGLTQAEVSQRSQEMQQMSAIERARLQRNWELFQKLPPEQQQHYRQLHRELEQDRGELKQLVTTYSQWLQTLSPGQREVLRKAKDPVQKLDLVRKYKEEQDRQQEGHSLDEDAFTPGQDRRLSQMLRRMFHDRTPLSSGELRAVMDALLALLPADDQTRIQGQEKKWVRYREILEAGAREAGGPKEWPNRDQQSAIRGALKESSQLQFFDRAPEEMRRNLVAWLLCGSLIAEMLEDSKNYRPKESELQQILQHLEDDERDELLQLPEIRWKDELVDKYYRKKTDQAFLDFKHTKQEFLKFLYRFFEREMRPGGGFGGRGGRSGLGGTGGSREFGRNREGKSEFTPRDGFPLRSGRNPLRDNNPDLAP